MWEYTTRENAEGQFFCKGTVDDVLRCLVRMITDDESNLQEVRVLDKKLGLVEELSDVRSPVPSPRRLISPLFLVQLTSSGVNGHRWDISQGGELK